MKTEDLRNFTNTSKWNVLKRVEFAIRRGVFYFKHKNHLKGATLKGFCPDNKNSLTSIYLNNGYEFEINAIEWNFLPDSLYEEIDHLMKCVESWEEENESELMEEDFYCDIA